MKLVLAEKPSVARSLANAVVLPPHALWSAAGRSGSGRM